MTETSENPPVILFVDDEITALKYFQRAIGNLAPVITAESVEEGKRLLELHAKTLRVLVSDQRMPGAYGNELLLYARESYPSIIRILTTAYSELEHTIEAVNEGQIHRYIPKPWDIAVLRIELKQALDLSNIARDRDMLVREKLAIRQKQIISHRIGMIYTLCTIFSERENFIAVEAYLSAALVVGVTPPEPDWALIDHVDIVSSEARRSADFGKLVRKRLTEIEQYCEKYVTNDAFEVLQSVVGEAFRFRDGTILFEDESNLMEYLQSPFQMVVSETHASWLAYLIWLGAGGRSMQINRSEFGIIGRVSIPTAPANSNRLTAWIDQF